MTDAPTIAALNSWLKGFMSSGTEPKLMMVGPRSNYIITGSIAPLRGNALQRRIHKRFYKRRYNLDYDNLPKTVEELFPVAQ